MHTIRYSHRFDFKNKNIYLYGLSLFFGILSAGIVADSLGYYFDALDRNPEAAYGFNDGQPEMLRKRPLGEYQIIVERNIFSAFKAQPHPPSAPAPPEQPPIASTITELSLVGTVISYDKMLKIAIIKHTSSNKEEFYHEEDTVGPVRILKIMWNDVLIDNNGRHEILSIKTYNDVQLPGKETERRPARTNSASRRARQTPAAQ